MSQLSRLIGLNFGSLKSNQAMLPSSAMTNARSLQATPISCVWQLSNSYRLRIPVGSNMTELMSLPKLEVCVQSPPSNITPTDIVTLQSRSENLFVCLLENCLVLPAGLRFQPQKNVPPLSTSKDNTTSTPNWSQTPRLKECSTKYHLRPPDCPVLPVHLRFQAQRSIPSKMIYIHKPNASGCHQLQSVIIDPMTAVIHGDKTRLSAWSKVSVCIEDKPGLGSPSWCFRYR